MVNTAKKGYKKEYKARKELEADGWKIMFKSVRNRFGCIDFANLYDIVAYKRFNILNTSGRRYISLKHFGKGNYYKPHQKEISDFKKDYGKPQETYELWIWKSPRWQGRKPNKKWWKGGFIKVTI